MYKISPSTLESYRVFKLDLYDESLESFINKIKGEFKPTPQMAFGKTVHRYLEDPQLISIVPDNYTENMDGLLMISEVNQLEQIALSLPQGVNEMYHSEVIDGIKFNMVFDRIIGKEIREVKISSRFNGVDYYESSVQWKLYLLGSGCNKITYDIITHTEARPVKFKYIKPFSFIPYQNMQKDVIELANEFIDFCRYYNLVEKITVPSAQVEK